MDTPGTLDSKLRDEAYTGSTPALIASATVVSAAARSAGPAIVLIVPTDGAVNIEFLGVPAQHAGTGLGERTLTAICIAADTEQVPLTLHADPGFGADLRRLIRWYSRHGFTITKVGPSVAMRRNPMH